MNINEYINLLGPIPPYLEKYLNTNTLKRLKGISYFCGMDYASKHIYNFKYIITRFDHSLTTALLTHYYTKRKEDTIAALFHDASTPCFSHVIDYMNEDFITQESTEEKTEEILNNDKYLKKCLKQDNLKIETISNYKNFSIVDNSRPKLCTDRLDGIILTSLSWTKTLNINEIKEILYNTKIYINEENEEEIGFTSERITNKITMLNNLIDEYCHSKEDIYMMMLLSKLTRYLINTGLISYNDLYTLTEKEILKIIIHYSKLDKKFNKMFYDFKNITNIEIPIKETPLIKKRKLKPITNGKRIH